MKRRLLLRGLLLSLGSGAVATAHALGATRGVATGRLGEGAAGPSSESAPLSAVELDALVAFGEVVVEGRVLSAAERGYLAEHVEKSARADPDRLSLYRMTAGVLDRVAGRRFGALPIGERIALVSRHHLTGGDGLEGQPGPFGAEALALRTKIVPDLIDGYWSSPAGWLAVGYGTFPGRCGDLARYTRPEA